MNITRDEIQDILKGIGIILVVFGHALRGGLTGNYGLINHSWFFVDFLIYAVHMPLFFFLAGLNSFRSMNKGAPYLKSRFSVILKPYIIFSIVYFALNILMQKVGHVNKPLDIHDILNIWYSPISLMWFLYALFIMQITVFFSRKLQFALLGLIVVCLFAGAYLRPQLMPISIAILAHAPFFIMGYWASKFDVINRINLTLFKWPKLMIGIMVYFLGCYFAYYQLNILPVSPLTVPLSLIGIYVLYLVSHCLMTLKVRGLLMYLGKLSMPIYLLHLIPLAMVPRFLIKTHLYNQYSNLVAGTVFSLFFSICLYLFLKKIKASAYLGIKA